MSQNGDYLQLFQGWTGGWAHPNSPAGGGGPGRFKLLESFVFQNSACFNLPHYNSPAGLLASHVNPTVEISKKVILMINPGVLRPELISEYTRSFIKEIMATIGLETMFITSGIRSPERQAKAMYENILSKGVDSQLKLYHGKPGMDVINAYVAKKGEGEGEDEIIKAMIDKIEALSNAGMRVSKHCVTEEFYAKLNVIDVSYSKTPSLKRLSFEQEIEKAKSIGRVKSFISPRMKGGEPAYHIEIPQPPF